MYLCICVFVYLFISVFVYLCICLFVYLCICVFVYLCMCVFVFDIYMLLQKAYVSGSSTWSRGVSREARAAGRSEQDLWVRLPVSWGH